MMHIEEFDIKAEAFRTMTGHFAPAKDKGKGTYDEWDKWQADNKECIEAMLYVFDEAREIDEINKIGYIEVLEIKAEAFRRMTDHMSPGKDVGMLAYGEPYDVRKEAWFEWMEKYGECIDAMLYAFNKVMATDLDD